MPNSIPDDILRQAYHTTDHIINGPDFQSKGRKTVGTNVYEVFVNVKENRGIIRVFDNGLLDAGVEAHRAATNIILISGAICALEEYDRLGE